MASRLGSIAAIGATAPGVLSIMDSSSSSSSSSSSHGCLTLLSDPQALRQASLGFIGESLELEEHEARDLLDHDAIQDAFCEYSDSFLSSHPRASLPGPQGIQALYSLGNLFDRPEDFFDSLAVDYHHADFRGAGFVFWATEFLASEECEARWVGIADITDWKLTDQCGLGISILYVLHREWQANYQRNLRG